MAAGDAVATKGHVSKLQSSTQLHEPSLKPKPPGAKKEELHTEAKLKAGLLHGRKLEENLGSLLVVSDNGCAFHVEVHSVQKQERIQGHALLSSHCERCGRDTKIEHGSHTVACL